MSFSNDKKTFPCKNTTIISTLTCLFLQVFLSSDSVKWEFLKQDRRSCSAGKTREKTSCMHESVSNYSAQLIHSLNVGFIVQNYARFITTLLLPLTRLFSSSIPEKYGAHQSKSLKKIFCIFIFVCSIHVRLLKTTQITAITQRTGSLWKAIFYVKRQKHCHHIVLHATVCHMDVEKRRAIFLDEKAAETLLFSSLHNIHLQFLHCSMFLNFVSCQPLTSFCFLAGIICVCNSFTEGEDPNAEKQMQLPNP